MPPSLKKCTVYFNPDLDDDTINEIIRSIHLFQGVDHVSTDRGTSKISSTPEFQQPQFQPPPQFQQQKAPSTRQVINQAIQWGLQNQLITQQTIMQMEASDLVQLALSLVEKMPETLKRQMAQAFAGPESN